MRAISSSASSTVVPLLLSQPVFLVEAPSGFEQRSREGSLIYHMVFGTGSS